MKETREENAKKADQYISTLQSMCLDFQMNRAITIETFVSNLRLFATCIEKDCLPKSEATS